MEEIWKPVKYINKEGEIFDYSGLYEINSNCDIRVIPRLGTKKKEPYLIKRYIDKRGYEYCVLSKNNEKQTFKLHRIGMSSFNPEGWFKGAEVNHKDENKRNNNIENLEWCTSEYNHNYGTRNIRASLSIKIKKYKPVLQYDNQNNIIKEWPSGIEIKNQLGFSQSAISQCCNGKLKTAYGFIWKYK